MIAALVDGLKASPEFISSTSFSQTLINFSQNIYHYQTLVWAGLFSV